MRVCLLASGSKGNSLFIEAGDSRILVDAGLSARELTRRLDGSVRTVTYRLLIVELRWRMRTGRPLV